MPSFGLITEGVTDQAVIENIIWGVFGEDADVNVLQPEGDETYQRQAEQFGGWYNVLQYCASPRFVEALPYNEFLIVQIDTDCCHQPHYGVSRQDEAGNDLGPEELIEAIKAKLISHIGEEIWTAVSERVIFAIAVDSIECWVLILHAPQDRKSKYSNCLYFLENELARHSIKFDQEKSKTWSNYDSYSFEFTKKKKLSHALGHNVSLDIFVEKLRSLKGETE